MKVSIAIPTYNRGPILVQTIERLLTISPRAQEILVIDQTPDHDPKDAASLEEWSQQRLIRWVRLPAPSIPHAMNEALRLATSPIVLYIDDDIIPCPSLVGAHAAAFEPQIWAVAGQVLQPGEYPVHAPKRNSGQLSDLEFAFNHDERCFIENVMAGNLSVRRTEAIRIGGFDENFVGAAYRFETDFARRIVAAGGLIRFEPLASIHHLHLPTGGIRAHGDHRTTMASAHSVGDYYFARLHVRQFWRYALRRFVRNVATRWHMLHPWALPAKITAEVRGLFLSRRLLRHGRKLLERTSEP